MGMMGSIVFLLQVFIHKGRGGYSSQLEANLDQLFLAFVGSFVFLMQVFIHKGKEAWRQSLNSCTTPSWDPSSSSCRSSLISGRHGGIQPLANGIVLLLLLQIFKNISSSLRQTVLNSA
jgi:hypothetical protein